MPIDPVKIPANIQIEEKIIGPASLRQIAILMISGGISYVIWSAVKAGGHVSLEVTLLCWTPLLIGAAFAFVKINDVSLFTFVLLLIERIEKPSKRTFGHRAGIEITLKTAAHEQKKKKEEQKAAEPEKAPDVAMLSKVLDTEFPGQESQEHISISPLEESIDTPMQDDDASPQVFTDIHPPQS